VPDDVLLQIVQVAGSLMILAAFVGVQAGRMRPDRRDYLLLNFVGSFVLTITGLIEAQWGFVLLEGVWALVSLGALLGFRAQTSHPGS
jgi:hypothetical protein